MLRVALTGSALAGGLLLASVAHAKQFVVADATYTHSAQTTTDSHYKVDPTPETPADWANPVDYATGSVHVRLEVKTKPSDAPTRFQICFEMKVNYSCTDQVKAYTAPGVYEWDTDVQAGYRPGPVDFSQGILRTALILKDTNNVKPSPENVGAATAALYLPSDLRVTVTVVSAGSEYEPPTDPTSSGGSGGGGGSASSGGIAGNDGAGGSSLGGGGGNAGGSGSAGDAPSAGVGGAGGSMITASGGSAPAVDPVTTGGSTNQLGSSNAGDDASCSLAASHSRSTLPGLLAGLLGSSALLRRVRRSAGKTVSATTGRVGRRWGRPARGW